MKTTEHQPHGHLQVKPAKPKPGKERFYFAYWHDAAGKHGKTLGPAHVKDSGRRTRRGAVIWRAAAGPKPTPRHLTPNEAKEALADILREAPRQLSVEAAGTLLDALEASFVERLRDGKIKASRRPDYEAIHGRLCRDLGNKLIGEYKTAELTEYIRGLEAHKFIGVERAREARREGLAVKEIRIATWVVFPPLQDPVERRAAMRKAGHMEALELVTQGYTIEERESTRWALCSLATPETRLKYRDLLAAAFEYAVSQRWIRRNPVDEVPRPAGGGGSRDATLRRTDFYDRDEVARLLEQATDTLERAFWLCGCHAGLRLPGEGQGLVWGSVDFKANVLRAQDGWTRGERGGTKTGQTVAIPMTPELREALAELKQRDYRTADDDPVFTLDRLGQPVPESKMRDQFQAAAKRAGLKRIKMYNLRHSFGTSLAASGRVPLRTIQGLMRHRKASTTEIYTAYSPQPDLAHQMAIALATGDGASATVAGALAGDSTLGAGDLNGLRAELFDRLDEEVPAKWLRTVTLVFDEVASKLTPQPQAQ